jgi:hypothetical protein
MTIHKGRDKFGVFYFDESGNLVDDDAVEQARAKASAERERIASQDSDEQVWCDFLGLTLEEFRRLEALERRRDR